MNPVIPIYLGTHPKFWLASEVLRYSIVRRTKAKVVFHDLAFLEFDPYLKLPTTGFSRWLVPYFEKYKGKAIYLDAQALVLDDIANLYNTPMDDKGVLACPIDTPPGIKGFYTEVMLLDNSKLRDWNPKGWIQACQANPALLSKIMHALPGSPSYKGFGSLSADWCLQDKESPSTKLIHFGNSTLYPWAGHNHPAKLLFLKELKSALLDEQISLVAILKEMEAKRVASTLLEEMTKIK